MAANKPAYVLRETAAPFALSQPVGQVAMGKDPTIPAGSTALLAAVQTEPLYYSILLFVEL